MLRAWTSLKMQENNIDRFIFFSSRLSFKLDEDWKRYTRIDFLIGFSFLPSSRNIFYFREAREWVEIEMRGYDRLTSNISDCFAWNGERNGDRRFFAMPVESKYTCSGWNKNRSIYQLLFLYMHDFCSFLDLLLLRENNVGKNLLEYFYYTILIL